VQKKSVEYNLKESGEFVITDYNRAKLFSSFFPGIAGENGIPMWLFYVNRGQCVCSMGIEDKQKPIMEFLPANWAYQLTSTQGFRTFIKPKNKPIQFYEPFQNHLCNKEISKTQSMKILPGKLVLEEENQTLGLVITVEYFNVPNDKYAGLIRRLTIKNLNREPFSFECLDGLPLIIPYGISNDALKFVRRIMEAFVEVTNYENNAPLFKGKVEPADRPDVVRIKKGNFYIGFESNGSKTNIVKPLVDPVSIFGSQSDYSYPERFMEISGDELYEGQILENRLPSAMGYFENTIQPGKEFVYNSIIGQASSAEMLNKLLASITNEEYLNTKDKENSEIIEILTQNNFICSAENVFDQYARQNFLDNTLRGGFPFTISKGENPLTLHLFSRKHGDLERDYNDYRLSPTPYSQGNGNFRDVNQNRRNDLFFNPDVKEKNVEHFFNLIQLDGFNPLVIRETFFEFDKSGDLDCLLNRHLNEKHQSKVKAIISKQFTPGELCKLLIDEEITLLTDLKVFICEVLQNCTSINSSNYGEGFWTDHWTYNLDLLENYLAVYPENLSYILLENKNFSFYDNPHKVMPRIDKFVLWDGKPMQLNSVVYDKAKEEFLNKRKSDKNIVHTELGTGIAYKTNLLSIMLCLITNKMASLDPNGVGVEMEADKPNWYDALNGLPGLIGSSINETLEIKRFIDFVLLSLNKLNLENTEIPLYEELYNFIDKLTALLKIEKSEFDYWDKSACFKEDYRKETLYGISGNEKSISLSELTIFLELCLEKLSKGIEKAWNEKENVISTYFVNDVVSYEEIKITDQTGALVNKTNSKGLNCFVAKEFKQTSLPLFLEGTVHFLRSKPSIQKAKELAKNVKNSGLFDQKLKMYKVNASLKDQPMEIGRARTFSPGWFENESIWLHMEYKYMLELLRNGLFEEFYSDLKNIFVPFFKPEVYGRSILENSSFIASSSNPDTSVHGNGFVARLSGATAEFIHILLMMTVGEKPFNLSPDNQLQLRFNPALAEWFFTKEARKCKLFLEDKWQEIEFPAKTYSFMFLGTILVTYHNPSLRNTYGFDVVSPQKWIVRDLAGQETTYWGNFLTGEIAENIRDRKVSRIDIELN